MYGIELNKPIIYNHSSLRFFDKNEHHITRLCENDVLLLVYDGVLRFSEDGADYEINPGQYHIQKANSFQEGKKESDSPKYLYVHFRAEWGEENTLSRSGSFDYTVLKPHMELLDKLSHGEYTAVEKSAKFFEILSLLYRQNSEITVADRIAEFISQNLINLTLSDIADEFHFSKNHIINIFKKEYSMTPFEYITLLKIRHAKKLLEVTSKTADAISLECGFNDYSHFYKAFKKNTGLPPVEWRRIKRINP